MLAMSRKKLEIKESDLRGFKYFKTISKLLEHLHTAGTSRDKAGNRNLHMDQYMTMLLLGMFSPICTSLRSIQQASKLQKVQRKLGVPRASLGSFSDAARVFDSDLLLEIIDQLAGQIKPKAPDKKLNDIKQILTLVDVTLFTALPKTVNALWKDDDHKGYKAHVHYELFKSVPVKLTLTDANTSERQVLLDNLEKNRLYVLDRGYGSYQLMQDIIDASSSFVCRIPVRYSRKVIEDIELTEDAKNAYIFSDQIVKFGKGQTDDILKQPLRLIELKCTERTLKSVRLGRKNNCKETTMLIATNRLDLDADTIALIYHYRWQIEIFFRYFKHMLGCRHLLSYCDNGIELQTYAGIIACLLIALYTGGKPTKRTFEMFCWYAMGWASDEEMMDHISKLKPRS
jgi:hypothetical protein